LISRRQGGLVRRKDSWQRGTSRSGDRPRPSRDRPAYCRHYGSPLPRGQRGCIEKCSVAATPVTERRRVPRSGKHRVMTRTGLTFAESSAVHKRRQRSPRTSRCRRAAPNARIPRRVLHRLSVVGGRGNSPPRCHASSGGSACDRPGADGPYQGT